MKVTHVTLNDVCRLLLWKVPILETSVRRQLFGARECVTYERYCRVLSTCGYSTWVAATSGAAVSATSVQGAACTCAHTTDNAANAKRVEGAVSAIMVGGAAIAKSAQEVAFASTAGGAANARSAQAAAFVSTAGGAANAKRVGAAASVSTVGGAENARSAQAAAFVSTAGGAENAKRVEAAASVSTAGGTHDARNARRTRRRKQLKSQ